MGQLNFSAKSCYNQNKAKRGTIDRGAIQKVSVINTVEKVPSNPAAKEKNIRKTLINRTLFVLRVRPTAIRASSKIK